MREGPSFGVVYTTIIDSSVVVYVPRGIDNSYQTLEPNITRTYLVSDHWSPDATYTFLNPADRTAAVDWLIPLAEAVLSDKNKARPCMARVIPFPAPVLTGKRVLVTRASGQLGRELMRRLLEAGYQTTGVDLPKVGTSDVKAMDAFDWSRFGIIINAVAQANADGTEPPEGRPMAWRVNTTGSANFAKVAPTHDLTLVHISTECVLDGSCFPHPEDEASLPLGTYAQAKAGGGAAATMAPEHYLIRTSWVIDDGKSFLRQILELASQGVAPQVVSDRTGCLTFTNDFVVGILHLLETRTEYDTYNLSGEGPVVSWVDIAKHVYEFVDRDPDEVTPALTEEYFSGREGVTPRPLASTLDLDKIKATGFTPADSMKYLDDYVRSLPESKED